MANEQGNMADGYGNVANGGFLNCQPSGTLEIMVQTIYHENSVELYWFDGTNSIKCDEDPGFGVYDRHEFRCKNARYLRIKNVSGGNANVAWTGVITKLS